MALLKLCSLILFYFLSRVAFGAPCEKFEGLVIKENLCFDKSLKSWISEKCLGPKGCEAKSFFEKKKTILQLPKSVGGQNPAALYCHELKLPVVILRDSHKNEMSFCQFPDKSLVNSNAIERFYQ